MQMSPCLPTDGRKHNIARGSGRVARLPESDRQKTEGGMEGGSGEMAGGGKASRVAWKLLMQPDETTETQVEAGEQTGLD